MLSNSSFEGITPVQVIKQKYPDLVMTDADYDRRQHNKFHEAHVVHGDDLIRVEPFVESVQVLKTGLVCPGCYNSETDMVIWGIHSKQSSLEEL